MKKAVLIMAYGAPNKPEDIEPFYTDIRRGRKPSPELLQELTDRYAYIGGSSPLLTITKAQAAGLEKALGDGTKVYVGMRHWEPWIKDTVKQMEADGIEEAVAMVMAPHYSKMSIGKYMEILDETVAGLERKIHFHQVLQWHEHPLFIKALETRLQEALSRFETTNTDEIHIFFTAHSLPERILEWQDPYPEQLNRTAELVAERLDLSSWSFAFQSAGRTPEPWLGPDILGAMRSYAEKGVKQMCVCVVGFIADHLEVMYDIDFEAQEEAKKLGVHLERIKMLNADDDLMGCLKDVVEKAFGAVGIG